MAQADLNSVLTGLRGKVGDLIYKRYGDKTVVTRVPKFSGKWSPKQRANRRVFGLASDYAEKVRADPVLKALYARLARKRKQAIRAVAICDYLTPPTIEGIDASGYRGRPGDKIVILAGDDVEVVAVRVVIRDVRGAVIEEGAAVGGSGWQYTATKLRPPNESVAIEVTATDHPGNQTVRFAE